MEAAVLHLASENKLDAFCFSTSPVWGTMCSLRVSVQRRVEQALARDRQWAQPPAGSRRERVEAVPS